MAFFWVLGIIVCIAVALWPATIAKNKGYSFFLYFLLSIPFWWITLFVVYFGLKDKTLTAQDRADDKAAEKAVDSGAGVNKK